MKAHNFKSFALNVMQLYFVQGLNYVLPLLCLPYLLTKLSPDAFGTFSFGQAFVQFIILFVDFGFNMPVSKKIALNANDDAFVLSTYKRIITLKFVLFGLAVLLLLPIFYSLASWEIYRTAVLLSLITVLGSILSPLWLFQGLNQLKTYNVFNAISRFVTLPFIFILIKDDSDYITPTLLYSSALFLAGLISIAYLYANHFYKGFWKVPLFFHDIKSEIRDSYGFFLSNSAVSLYTNGLIVVLGAFSTSSVVGLFGAIDRFVRMICFSVFVPISQAAFPMVSRLGVEDINSGKKLLKKIIFLTLGLLSLILLGYFMVENIIISRFFKDYPNVRSYLRIAIFTILPIGVGGALGQLGLVALGGEKEKKLFYSGYLIVGLVIFPMSILLIMLSPLNGAITAMMGAEIFVFLWMAFIAIKRGII